MMRVREILQEYEKGRRDFQGVSLRGLSFKGKDLSGADFSGADIRGTNFRGANLSGAKFQGARAGLQKRWVVVLLVVACALVVISAFVILFSLLFLSLIYNSDNPEQQNTALVALALLIIFWATIIHHEIPRVHPIVAFTFGFVISQDGFVVSVFVAALARAIFLAFTGVLEVAGDFGVAGVLGVAGVITFAGATLAAGFFDQTFALTFAFALTGLQIMLSVHIAYEAIKRDEKYPLTRGMAIAFAAIGGTSFTNANLTDADFTNATLKSTDFRGADITRTCWKDTIKLDCILTWETYLKNSKLRELVRTGQGKNQNFNRSNYLKGINLQGANLTNASFIEANLNSANLQDADLSRAKLVGTFLDRTDLTGATLTGAFIEDWRITRRTKLDRIKCDYVYMRLPPEKRPEFLKLTPQESLNDNPRRQPADWEKNFEEGEFVDFITPMVEILNIYHNQAVDPQLHIHFRNYRKTTQRQN
ncbi:MULTISPECIES: pentapeptide repeat-containing protein [Okeania]|uniref:Pentapeptide repeat-containing protein n=1 Tax=Okeania hirsuta TaxID=1458930 RepID=A0A3N6N8P4_9CYAN|nr:MULTISPECIES: pentapeptide repeat-containing protein [Okeania]NES91466.1 pentapeptide repeat-containing protein [Okeania sp. SIO2B9]NET80157.1 pentapeptide repeat-containing protein [Okeania sp. SIO1F9]RQH07291.1 hypothetical protein D4Z78_29565 [Okeania hirsuta]RQH28883.1 hypothetical protein D5R40_25190 [Okeania hirsuta]